MDEPLLNRRTQIGLSVLLAAALLLLIQFGRPSPSGLWMATLYESMHVLLFGVIALCVIVITPSHWQRRKRLLTIAVVVIALSLLSEAAQIPTNRDASLEDLIADWLGAAAFSLVAIAFASSFRIPRGSRKYLITLGLVLLAWSLMPLVKVSAAYIERARALPALVDFDAAFARTFMRLQNAELAKTPGSNTDGETSSALITLLDGPWPGVVLHDLYPGWDQYEALVIELENPETESLVLNFRVDDDEHRFGEQRYSDRFNSQTELEPGRQTYRVSLSDIKNGPANRQMDLSRIDGLIIFAKRKDAGRTFIIHSIRLD